MHFGPFPNAQGGKIYLTPSHHDLIGVVQMKTQVLLFALLVLAVSPSLAIGVSKKPR